MNKNFKGEKQRKFYRASSVLSKGPKGFLYFAVLLVIVIFISYTLFISPSNSSEAFLTIVEETTGKTLKRLEVKPGDEITFYWIHSVEHIPWIEFFVINKDYQLVLEEIRFKGFGAGIPHNKGREIVVEGGYIIMKDIGEIYTSYNWINSHTATDKIMLNGNIVVKGKDLPHHEYMKMLIQER